MTAADLPPPVPAADEDDLAAQEHRALVHHYVHKARAEDEARRIVRQERAGALQAPSPVLLTDFLVVEDDPVTYRVDQLWPVDGRVVCAAQYKAGKTTLRDNLVRCLADGDPFLDHFEVTAPERRVVLIDNEMSESMMRRWLREQGIRKPDRVAVLPLKGKVGSFDLLDQETRAGWAEQLRAFDPGVLILDCLRPVLDALGLDENRDAGRFLVAFDALVAECGATEAVLVHHMGHNGERSRGDTRIRDWPDVEWTIVREKGEDGESDPAGPRFFKAYGRDVDQPEGQYSFNPEGRRLIWAGSSRQESAADKLIPEVLDYLASTPAASGRAIETALSHHKRASIRAAVRRSIALGQVSTQMGPRRAVLHSAVTGLDAAPDPADESECASAPSAPEVRQRSSAECASAPIGRAQHTDEVEAETPSAHSGSEVGPCIRCQRSTTRYGEAGQPLCDFCRLRIAS